MPRPLRGAMLACAMALFASWLLTLVGVGPALDRVAERGFYYLRAARNPGPILFVAIDEATAKAWGPPPWTWNRYLELIAPLRAGGAKFVALVEPGPRVIGELTVPLSISEAVAAGWLIVPSAADHLRQPSLAMSDVGVVDSIDLGDVTEASVTRTLFERIGATIDSRTLVVNFLGGPDRLPVVSAHHVATGALPPSTFLGRTVVIGVRGERFTSSVPTPVGRMAPAEVHAHALQSVMAGARLTDSRWWVTTVATLIMVATGILLQRRLRRVGVVVTVIVGAEVLLLLVAYITFAYGNERLAVGGPSLTLVSACVAGLLLDRADAARGLDTLRRQLRHRLRLGASTRAGASEAEILDRFAETLRAQLPVSSLVWAVLPPGQWHLKLERWYEASEADIGEQRRDVRRDPWRLPYGSHKPEWASRPIVKDALAQRTLLVPLAAQGRLIGFWIVNVPMIKVISDAELRAVETWASDAAAAIRQHAVEWKTTEAQPTADALAGALQVAVQVARDDVAVLVSAQDRMRTALEHLPVGVLGATSWGMIEHCNAAMRRFLAAVGINVPERVGLIALLTELTDTTAMGARASLREVAIHGRPLRFAVEVIDDPSDPESTPIHYDLTLSRVEVGESALGERIPTAIVLTAAARPPEVEPTPSASATDGMGQVIPIRKADEGPKNG